MGVFQEMDPELALRAIEGYQDELSPERAKQVEFYRGFSCPRCQCSLNEEIDAKTTFSGDGLIPKALLRCSNCSYAIEPHTNLIVSYGNAAKTPVEIIPIIGGKYIEDP